MEIGIKTLKAHLSAYLEKAAAGEVIVVTERGKPKAILTAVPVTTNVDQGIKAKWIRPGDNSIPVVVSRQVSTASTEGALLDDRGE